MGICATEPKKPKIIIEVSEQNKDTEKNLSDKLKELLVSKGINIEYAPITIKKDLLYMKIVYQKGNENSMTLASGTSEVTEESLEKIADEIAKKVKDAKND